MVFPAGNVVPVLGPRVKATVTVLAGPDGLGMVTSGEEMTPVRPGVAWDGAATGTKFDGLDESVTLANWRNAVGVEGNTTWPGELAAATGPLSPLGLIEIVKASRRIIPEAEAVE